jgi:hypothetical protein
MLSGIACIAGSLWFWSRLKFIRKDMRPIYEQLGILQPKVRVVIEEEAGS